VGVPDVYRVLVEGVPIADVVKEAAGVPRLLCVPATIDLAGADIDLVSLVARESRLQRAIDAYCEGPGAHVEYVIVDCPPSLGLLTVNALVATREVLIPIQCEYYALEGISQLLNTVKLVQQNFNPALAIDGVLLTMYDSRLNLCRQVAEDAKEYFDQRMFKTVIPRNIRLAEAPSFGKPILLYDIQSVGARSYLAVAQELLRRVGSPRPADISPAVPEVGA
jgi:chromosome partitioning protein